MAKGINWLTEEEAVKAMKNVYSPTSLQIFTRNEKRKKLPIRTTKIGKKILYSGVDIENFLNQKHEAE